MATKKKWLNLIANAFLLMTTLFSVMRRITTLIELEARQAKKSLMVLIMLFFISNILLATIWFCLLALLFNYLTTSLHLTSPVALLIILLTNIILIFIVHLIIKKTSNNLTFKETRKQLTIKK